MATECTQDAVLQFLTERGGKVRNVDLIDQFKPLILNDPAKKALAKERFKEFVDTVGFVKVENDVKYVCLKKKYRDTLKQRVGKKADGDNAGSGIKGGPGTPVLGYTSPCPNSNVYCSRGFGNGLPAESDRIGGADFDTACALLSKHVGGEASSNNTANDVAKHKIFIPMSDYGASKGKRTPPDVSANISEGKSLTLSEVEPAVGAASPIDQNSELCSDLDNKNTSSSTNSNADSCNRQRNVEFILPSIAVTEASPLPTEVKCHTFSVPENKNAERIKERCFSQPVEKCSTSVNLASDTAPLCCGVGNEETVSQHTVDSKGADGESCADPDVKTVKSSPGLRDSKDDLRQYCKGAHLVEIPNRRQSSRNVFQPTLLASREQQSGKLAEDRTTYCQPDSSCASGTESGGSTPKGSRKIFRDMMMNNSPQLRRSMALKTPGSLLPRWRDSMKSESDSVSLVSSTDEDSRSLALDPMEHEWMMCASDGQWESLNRLLACDPNLVIKRDFVTGFTCLHWAAKHGKQELIALLVNFAKQHAVPLNINTRSSAGYTPLHLAAMHNHEQVVKLLVGAYDADVDIRDYSGKKAWQYLRENVGGDIRDIVGAAENSDADNLGNGAGRWRLSKVLPSNLLPHKLLNLPEDDSCVDGAAVKPKSVYRQTSMSRIRPKLKQIRFKTQIIHSSFFKETEDGERPLKSPAKSRPKSNLFG
ncbi:ankyrin repeat domain-containing protein SOWAHC-like [Polyodon spathula]|uniref:ankyrin repeat domain-containing protein SOWAHC-like n=1 Tax=Polyodon spathula TaxID=7913 RepID=UPI001B7EABD9|nr:ankyrin repeat domain-containing protein SOWAHC-like [Polyodon spathula]